MDIISMRSHTHLCSLLVLLLSPWFRFVSYIYSCLSLSLFSRQCMFNVSVFFPGHFYFTPFRLCKWNDIIIIFDVMKLMIIALGTFSCLLLLLPFQSDTPIPSVNRWRDHYYYRHILQRCGHKLQFPFDAYGKSISDLKNTSFRRTLLN